MQAWAKRTAPPAWSPTRGADGAWTFLSQGPLSRQLRYELMTMTTPAVPAGATNLSVGISLRDVGSVTGDDYYLGDADGGADTTDPTVALTAPAAGAGLSGTATLTATASDNAGVARVEFRVDDQIVGSDATAPYAYAPEHRRARRRAARDPGARGRHRQRPDHLCGHGDRRGQRAAAARAEPAPEPVPRGRRGPGGRRPGRWQLGGSGNNAFSSGPVGDARTGSWAERSTITAYTDGDRRLISSRTPARAPRRPSRPPLPGARLLHVHRPCAPRRVLPLERRRVDVFNQGAVVPASAAYVPVQMTTPPVPAGRDPPQHRHLAAGGRSVTGDDYHLSDVDAAP